MNNLKDKEIKNQEIYQHLQQKVKSQSGTLSKQLEDLRSEEIRKNKTQKKTMIRRLQNKRIWYLKSKLLNNPTFESEYLLEKKRHITPLPDDDLELDNIMKIYEEYSRNEL